MIVVYPMIVSKTVSQDVLPGVCKALEQYILVYDQRDLFIRVNKQLTAQAKKDKRKDFVKRAGSKGIQILKNSRGRLKLESVDFECDYVQSLLNEEDPPKDPTASVDYEPDKKSTGNVFVGPTTTTNTSTSTSSGDFVNYAPTMNSDRSRSATATKGDSGVKTGNVTVIKNAAADRPKQETVKVGKVNSDSLSVEPTYIHVGIEGEGSRVLGVKVVPFPIQNDTDLFRLLMNDKNRSSFAANIHVQSRKLLKIMYRIANTLWKYTVGATLSWTGLVGSELYSSTITGDWKRDIILGMTSFKSDMFVMLNNVDLRKDFLFDAGSVKKLYKLGWTSLVLNDDPAGKTMFCMKEFKGLCSIVNHQFLYSSSRQHHEAFKDIGEIKKSNPPMFRMKGRSNNMILKDDIASEKLKKYCKKGVLSETEDLNEGIVDDALSSVRNFISSKSTIKRFLTNLKDATNSKDMRRIMKVVKATRLPNVSIDKLKIVANSKIDNFKEMHKFSTKVLNNSLPGINAKLVDYCSSIIAVQCKDKKDCVKLLKLVVSKTRSNMPKSVKSGDDDWDKELIVALVFAIILVAVIGTLGYGLITFLPEIIGSISSMLNWVLLCLFFVSLLWMLGTVFGGYFDKSGGGGGGQTVGTSTSNTTVN